MTSEEGREADRRYNDALTALDRAVVAAGARATLDREDVSRLTTALIVFLQQITAFVETKDRAVAADAAARMDTIERALEPLAELRVQMGVVQRAVQSLTRRDAAPPAVPASAGQHIAPQPDYRYVGFEDQFRGPDQAIEEKLRAYVPIFVGAAGPVVDLGCGRGEMLAALAASGVSARGVDINADMVAIARGRGLEAAVGDALAAIASAADGSLGGIVATQVAEHLEPAYLVQLLECGSHKLQPGAPIVIETINPACWLAFFSSYIRDLTHVRPIHPETLQYLLRANGFERVTVRYSAPVPDHVKMKTIDLPPAVQGGTDPVSIALASIAHAVSANAIILNSLMFTHLDYAAIAYRS